MHLTNKNLLCFSISTNLLSCPLSAQSAVPGQDSFGRDFLVVKVPMAGGSTRKRAQKLKILLAKLVDKEKL